MRGVLKAVFCGRLHGALQWKLVQAGIRLEWGHVTLRTLSPLGKVAVCTCRPCFGLERPVLKHGPRSLTCKRVFGWQTRMRSESDVYEGRKTCSTGVCRNHYPHTARAYMLGPGKMVNYAWMGRSQRKLWWRLVAVLTCKSRWSNLGIGRKTKSNHLVAGSSKFPRIAGTLEQFYQVKRMIRGLGAVNCP